MSSEDGDDPGMLTKAYRTVTPEYLSRPNAEMNSIGWVIFLGLLVLLIPLLPFMIILWLFGRALDFIDSQVGDGDEGEEETEA